MDRPVATTPMTASPEPEAPPTPARGVFGGGAWRLGRIRGIDVDVDHSWLIIFVLVTVSLGSQLRLEHPGWDASSRWGAAVVTSLLFFLSIVLHEFGHSVVAQNLGIRVRSITLFVFGGVASLERDPSRARDEIVIALAGPAVSFALALGFGALAGVLAPEGSPVGPAAGALGWLSRINLALGLFNLVPGFPLDGGRVLRGIVWSFTGDFERATSVAGRAGAIFAYALIALGVLQALVAGQIAGGLWLAFIGWFLLNAARATVGQVVLESVLQRVRVEDAMAFDVRARVAPDAALSELVEDVVLRSGLRTLYVTDAAGRLLGLFTLREIAQVPSAERAGRTAADVMIPLAQLALARPSEDCWTALREMAAREVNQLPVLEGERLVGTLTRERLLALVEARSLLGGRARKAPQA